MHNGKQLRPRYQYGETLLACAAEFYKWTHAGSYAVVEGRQEQDGFSTRRACIPVAVHGDCFD